MKKIWISCLWMIVVCALSLAHSPIFAKPRKFVVLTDWEPDDKVGIHVLRYYTIENDLGLVGTTLLNSERKRVLAQRTIADLGWINVPVKRGTGGTKDQYPDIASSKQAREYTKEGQGILSSKELAALELATRDGRPFQEAFEQYLRNNDDVEVVIMSAPTDIIEVLERYPELLSKIKRIHVMGGWVLDDAGNLRSTFNWNMGHLASARLLALSDRVQIRLYSSHMVKKVFGGGSISRKNMPELMSIIEFARSNLRGLQDLEIASRLWDEEAIQKIPKLRDIIGIENIGKQFTPADIALVISLFHEKRLETRTVLAGISLDTNDLDPQKGFAVRIDSTSRFPIEIVEDLDIKFFEEEMKRVFKHLPKVVENGFRDLRFSQARLNASQVENRLQSQLLKPVSILSLGQNINYISERLKAINPEEYFLVLDATKDYAFEFSRMARRLKYKVYGLSPAADLSKVTGFSPYDDFYVTHTRRDLSKVLKIRGYRKIQLKKPIDEEIYLSFHTKNQSLTEIEKSLTAIARKHPHATLVHGFLPRSQIHYLPAAIQPVVIQTLDLIDRYFPKQVKMRNSYVGLGDTRQEMVLRAARNRSRVYVVGDISGGVAEEALMHLNAGSIPHSLPLGETDIKQATKISFADDCLRPLLELSK